MKLIFKRVLFVIVTLMCLALIILSNTYTPSYNKFYINGTEVKRHDDITEKKINDQKVPVKTTMDVYYAYATLANDTTKHYSFRNEIAWTYFKFETSLMQSKIAKAATEKELVEIRYYGWNLPWLFDKVPNIISIKPVSPESSDSWRVFLWIMVVFSVGLWIFLIATICALFADPRNPQKNI